MLFEFPGSACSSMLISLTHSLDDGLLQVRISLVMGAEMGGVMHTNYFLEYSETWDLAAGPVS